MSDALTRAETLKHAFLSFVDVNLVRLRSEVSLFTMALISFAWRGESSPCLSKSHPRGARSPTAADQANG